MTHNHYKTDCPYEHYYSHQAGSGVGVIYKGAPYQRGHGIGSFLGGLFRSVFPIFKSGAKAIGKEALNTGVGLLTDMINSRPMNESIKTRLKEASSNLKRKADQKVDNLVGSGYKSVKRIKRLTSSSRSSRRKGEKKTRRVNKIKDIFSK